MHYSEEVLSEISLPFYELKGRCEETAGNYEGALFAYREKSRRILKRTHCGASVRLFAYTLFRIGEIYYLQGNYEEADKGFCKVITFLSKEYPPKDSDEFFSKMFFYGIELPKPLHTKVASLIYLADIARKKGMDFVYERELKETIKLARQTKDNDLISLVDRLEIIINDAKN